MRIVVNHLTRMYGGHICVAGVDTDTGRHVRPVLPTEPLSADLLARNLGPFDVANVVELGRPKHRPKPPHVEDHVFKPRRAKLVDVLGPDIFWAMLYALSQPRLQDIFGESLRPMGRASCGTPLGRGEASLGCLRPGRRQRPPYVAKRPDGRLQVRLAIDDGQLSRAVGVTDLRLYGPDHATPDPAKIQAVADRLRSSAAVVLSVGLTRAFSTSSMHEHEPVHWLQVNNIHLEDDPTWQLG
jgi:hypothetical protein